MANCSSSTNIWINLQLILRLIAWIIVLNFNKKLKFTEVTNYPLPDRPASSRARQFSFFKVIRSSRFCSLALDVYSGIVFEEIRLFGRQIKKMQKCKQKQQQNSWAIVWTRLVIF